MARFDCMVVWRLDVVVVVVTLVLVSQSCYALVEFVGLLAAYLYGRSFRFSVLLLSISMV